MKGMMSKVAGILVCMMMTTTFLTTAINVDDTDFRESLEEPIAISSDDAPTWNIGDTWTYKIDSINIDIEDNKSIHIHLQADEIPMTVVDDTGNSYILNFSAEINGNYSIHIEQDSNITDMEGKIKQIKIKGEFFLRKSDLGIEKINVGLSGILTVKVNEQSLIDFPIPKIFIPFPVTVTASVDFDTPCVFIDFPLDTNKTWGMNTTSFSINGEVYSIWFNIINFINKIAMIFDMEIIPPEIADLLPIIDIKDALEANGMSNIFEIPETPDVFTCPDQEMIELPGLGTFNAYNISVAGGNGKIYYVPDIKNIAKISGQLGDLSSSITDINMELIDYRLV